MPLLSRQMVAFLVVAEELHFGRAARRLHISQPPLSQQIRQIEAEVGVQLFERTTRSVRLTPAGEHLAAQGRQWQTQGDSALETIRRIAAGSSGMLTLGFTSSAAYRTLPGAIAEFRRRLPGFSLRLREHNSRELWLGVLAGRIDVALLRRDPSMEGRDMHFTSAGRERLLVAVPRGHALARAPSIALRDLQGVDIIGFSREGSDYFRSLIDELFAGVDVTPQYVHESVLPTILSLVEGGLGVALVPESATPLWAARVALRNLRGTGAGCRAEFHVVRTSKPANPAIEAMARILVVVGTRSGSQSLVASR